MFVKAIWICSAILLIADSTQAISKTPAASETKKSSMKIQSYKGFRRPASADLVVYHEKITQYFQEGANFFLLIDHHSGFFRFPTLDQNKDLRVRRFLNESIKSGTPVQLQINLKTSEVVQLGGS